MLSDDALLIIEGRVEAVDGQEITLIVDDVKDLADARPRNARSAKIWLPASCGKDDDLNEIFSILSHSQGRCDVKFAMPLGDVEVKLESQIIRIEGSARLEKELAARGCSVEWIL